MVYFISDLHAFHYNVLKFDKRPFVDMEEMNNELRERWNKKVNAGDLVYCLGDMSWRCDKAATDYIGSLNGQKILISGNHDRTRANKMKNKFVAIKDYDELKVYLKNGDIKRCILSHYPIMMWNGQHYGVILLYGHVHNTIEEKIYQESLRRFNVVQDCNAIAINVGCMLHDYEPKTLDELLEEREN